MGKTLDELNLTDEPLEPEDLRDADWYRFSTEITDLLHAGRCNWAFDTLTDIQATVERTRRVTDGQRRAVANIEAAGNRRDDGLARRRYEGFQRRRR